jgi:hypothetical protein
VGDGSKKYMESVREIDSDRLGPTDNAKSDTHLPVSTTMQISNESRLQPTSMYNVMIQLVDQ